MTRMEKESREWMDEWMKCYGGVPIYRFVGDLLEEMCI